MSSTNNAPSPSPRAPRGKQHQHSKSATQTQLPNGGNQAPRRPRGNRRNNGNNGNNGNAQQNSAYQSDFSANLGVDDVDSAVVSSEEVPIPTGPRQGKKHTNSQPTADRVFSPTSVAHASLTDSEATPKTASATPAKPQGAYAGPTFHASPAPSALPIPKFLSKSVPAKSRPVPGLPSPPAEVSGSPPSPTPSPPSPSRVPISIPPRNEDSPLDILFKADRAERARVSNLSPASTVFSSPPSHPLANGNIQHAKQDSHSSLNAMFPIELEAPNKAPRRSPPAAAPIAHRSVTAPAGIPQTESFTQPTNNSNVVQDLLGRLNISQEKPLASTPPRVVDRNPSAPSSRHQTPSPFYDGRSAYRSASGPTTPAPTAQETPDFFYGNRNLSPLFKAAKTDSNSKRNSGLRTEITADSPVLQQGGFLPAPPSGPNNIDANIVENPNHRKPRTPGRRAYQPRPDSYPNAGANQRINGAGSGSPVSVPKTTSAMSFIPSSVQTKQHSAKPKSTPLSLEQELKQMLNMKTGPEATQGVR
ncbi:hypothetical protein BCR34DRAFT_476781 [Clohesyomyces aquaticus]|uniref:Proteophosphoglycan 5 n=1 Tax=Clohesyomyces aquaticus TaxID=1231657 RepID=A0A1Y2A0N6_9PLEO|nr:hypothetical protein BCR34DRAFT_476781 [Clohesyomyces aquaticus]